MYNNLKSFFGTSLLYLFASLLLIFILVKYLLPDGFIIAGHDSGLALDSKAFLETRFFAWDERINFGQDNSLLFGSLTIHTLDYLFSFLSGTEYAGNQFNLFFWLSMIFISAFVFGYQFKEKLNRNFVFIFPVLIVFNFYVFQSIFILERAKYSLIVATLFLLTIVVRLLDRKISTLPAAVLTSLIFSVFNGGSWLGLPLYGGILIIIVTILFFILISDIKTRNFQNSISIFIFLFLSAIFFLVLNSYSLLPYLQTFLTHDYLIIQNPLALEANKAWGDYISQGSSFLNIFKMQGVPDWYVTKFTVSETHPYASLYLNNNWFIALSYILPIAAFGALNLVKDSGQKKIIGLTALISLVSMIFMSGPRSPLGFIYVFLYEHVSGFIIFRTPFYKFGYAFVIAYSVMLSFTFSIFIENLLLRIKPVNLKKGLNIFLIFLVIFFWMVYHKSFLNKNIFNWRTEFSTRIKIPGYVNDYKEYVRNQNIENGRTLILPELHQIWLSDGSDWGYWSLSTIHYSLTRQPVVANNSNLNDGEKKWVALLYKAIEEKDAAQTKSIASRLGITKFLLKNDALVGDVWSGGKDPKMYEESLKSFDFIEEEKQFGKWDLKRINSPDPPLLYPVNNLTEISEEDVASLRPFIQNGKVYAENEKPAGNILDLFTAQKIDRFKCLSCVLEAPVLSQQLVWPRILPNSLLFPLKLMNEQSKLKNISPSEKMDNYFGLILKRAAEADAMFYLKTHDAYIIRNLKIIDDYLDEITKITRSNSDPNSFQSAKHTNDLIHSLELILSWQISPDKPDPGSEIIKEAVSRTLWKIYQLKKFYSPILDNYDKWGSEKIYQAEITDPSSYQLYLNEDSLPLGTRGQRPLPKVTINQAEVTLTQNQVINKNWIPLNSDKLKTGKNDITLKFEQPPNLLNLEGDLDIQTPEGKKRCYKGSVDPSSSGDKYLLKVKTAGQVLRFFTREDSSDELTGFLDWNSARSIEARYDGGYFRFFYPKPKYTGKTSFYICGDYPNLPAFKEFIIEEISVPEIIGVRKFNIPESNLPFISYERLDPTKFNVSVKSATNPFILVMNQRYTPLWILKERKTNKELDIRPFQIDLYSTAWIIDTKGDLDLAVEYKPQDYFEKGVVVTGIVLAGLGILMLIRLIRNKKQ